MLAYLEGRASVRRLRLFACACFWVIDALLQHS